MFKTKPRPILSRWPDNIYDTGTGNLKKIVRKHDNMTIWEGIDYNKHGQLTFSIKGGIRQRMEYYPETGYLLSSTASDIQSFEYHYDVLGNMDHRYDHLHKVNGQSLHEQFYYDRRNQLTDTYLNGTLASHIIYDNLGNITSKSKMGGMEYQSGNSPYQLTGIVPDQNIDPGYKLSQNITYTDFNKVESITGNGYKLEIEYGLENQRISQSLSSVNQYGQTTLLLNKHFIGGLQEKIFYETGAEKTISYITSPEGLTAIEVKSGTSSEWYTVFTDHLGSITTLHRESDGLKFELSYDAWGNRRNPATWANYSGNFPDFITITDNDFITDRGFTGHEHLDMFGLINMSGRVYDPVASRFLSPDSFIQSPELALNYNGYVYCLNNPLIYTDPDGEFFTSLFLGPLGVIIDAACWGAVIGGAGYTASVAMSDGGFNNWNSGDFWKSVGVGALSGAVTAGIGSAFGTVGSNGIMGEIARAYTHGFANGMISEFTGGDFMTGFASGGLGSLAGSAFTFGGKFAESAVGTIGFSALAGGVGAELTGGDFWQGAATGAIVGSLNHMQHRVETIKSGIAQLRNLNAEQILGDMTSRMNVGDIISGDELAQYNPALDKAGYAIKGLTRTETGFKIKLTMLGRAGLAASGITIRDGSNFAVTSLSLNKTDRIFNVVSPGNKIYYGKNLIDLNLYINNNNYSIYKDFRTYIPVWK